MTYRSKLTDKMRKYLSDRLNCENVIKFIEKHISNNGIHPKKIKKLKVGTVDTAVDIIKYNDSLDNNNNNNNIPNKEWLEKILFVNYDFITEANYTGFEYFPYLYGVLNCHNNDKSKVYVFYEYFGANLLDLINKMEHPSEWYDIVFQLAIINHFLTEMHNYSYDGAVEDHMYNKLPKPIYQQYEFNNYQFNINHKYLIVYWNPASMKKTNNNNNDNSNIANLLKYLEQNKDKIKIFPSARIITLLNELLKQPSNTIEILNQYYNPKTQPQKSTTTDTITP